MSDAGNPFEAFQDPNNPNTADHRELLGQTQPWLILFGSVMALGALTMVLAAGAMGLFGLIGVAGLGSGGEEQMAAAGVAGGMMFVVLLFYGLGGLLYGGLAYFLLRQAVAISNFRRTGGLDNLADILRAHRDFWRVSGISVVVMMVLYCAGFGLFFLFGMGAAAFE